MKKIRLKLDTLLVLEGEYEEVRYNPAQWPKDESGNDLDKSICAWDGEKVVDNSLEVCKDKRKDYITECFDNEFVNGHFASTAIGIEVDYRRYDKKNDLQNVESLIKVMKRKSIPSVIYKGYEALKAPATVAQLESLAEEMEDYGVFLYNKKDTLKTQIDNAETIEDINAIVW